MNNKNNVARPDSRHGLQSRLCLMFSILVSLASIAVFSVAVVTASDGGSSSGTEIEAKLIGAPINNITPRGEAEFETEAGGGTDLKVKVENVNLPAGTMLDVLIDGTKVGTLTLGTPLAEAELELKSEHGDKIPQINSRSRVVVSTQAAVTVVAGSFSNIPPSPSPSPSPTGSPSPSGSPTPTPTPNPNAEVRLEAKLAGAAIGGLTPRGEAKFRSRLDQRRFEIEVERVNLPAGTVLNVLVDNVKVGTLTLTSLLEAESELETEHGQPVPNINTNTTVTITNALNQTVLAGVFNTQGKHMEGANDVDDDDFFVDRQYLDFLGREADDSGRAFWSNNISKCGADASCIEAMRVNTSAAFFLSIEFQETGGMIYRLNKASFGTLPRRQSFLIDAESTTRELIVGAPGWQQKLEDNKQKLADDWVSRPEFQNRFGALSDDKFVDALFQNAGVKPAEVERNDLIAALREHRETRAQVLRQVADNSVLRQKEQNSAFVLMQYFGYLHRNPDEGQDRDMSGFNFWLTKLNSAGGDFNKAEMVRAFIESTEYRNRFDW